MGGGLTRVMRLIGALAVMAATVIASPQVAAQSTQRLIESIRVEGTRRIEPDTVRSYMTIKVGDPFDAARIDRSLKALLDTGLFFNVEFRVEGGVLVVSVVENPIINRVAFEGNKRISDEALAADVQLRPRIIYTRSKMETAVKRIVELYRNSGRFAAVIEPKVIELPQNRIDLVFEIDEGPTTGIRKISFIGNRRFSDRTLRNQIETKESAWYRYFSSADTFDPDRLTFDRELLRRFYRKKGFADFRVVSAIAELIRDRTDFFVTFTVEEGQRYRFGKVDLKSEIPGLGTEELSQHVLTQVGDWFNADTIEDTIQQITDTVGSLGFAFVDVSANAERDRENRTVDLTYDIAKGPRVFVERINITGNFRTLDEVIRREFRLAEGDAFSTAKLRRSEQRIRNLGFFDKVEVTSVPGSKDDTSVINVKVAERSTGAITFGAGFSSVDGPLADVSIRERNLLGRGQDLRLALTVSGRRQQVDLRFTEPYFLDRDVDAGFDVFRRTTDVTDEDTFDQEALGFVLRGGYPITERLRHTLSYTVRRDEIRDVAANASRFIRAQEGSSMTLAVGHSLQYDVRDSRVDPSEGYVVRLRQDLAGVGGNVRYVRNRLNAAYYHPISDTWVGSLSASGGHIAGFADDDVRISDRFLVGSSTLRGFANAGIGPRDARTSDALGGNLFATGNAQLSFPLGLPSDFDIRGRVFTDIGTLTGIDDTGPGIRDEASLRTSIGVGLSVTSAFGPIIIDFAVPILKEDFDRSELVRFSFGTRF